MREGLSPLSAKPTAAPFAAGSPSMRKLVLSRRARGARPSRCRSCGRRCDASCSEMPLGDARSLAVRYACAALQHARAALDGRRNGQLPRRIGCTAAWSALASSPTRTPRPTAAPAAGTTATSTGPAPPTGVEFRPRGAVTRLRAYDALVARHDRCRRGDAVGAGTPTIVPRSGWGADEEIVRAKPRSPRRVRLAVVHHTAGTNSYTRAQAAAIVRGIEVYHVQGNGWNDIGYNFLVDRFGTVYEGRGGGIDQQRDRRARARASTPARRRCADRQLRRARRRRRPQQDALVQAARVAPRRRARRPAVDGRLHARAATRSSAPARS